MTISISGSFSASSSNTVATSTPAAEVENKATAGSADTVKLSQAAQVHLLNSKTRVFRRSDRYKSWHLTGERG
jgi:hypothetical protein